MCVAPLSAGSVKRSYPLLKQVLVLQFTLSDTKHCASTRKLGNHAWTDSVMLGEVLDTTVDVEMTAIVRPSHAKINSAARICCRRVHRRVGPAARSFAGREG